MITDDQIIDKVRQIMADELGVGDANLDGRFVEDFYADSLDMTEICISAEEAFDLDEIPDNEFDQVKTPRDLIALIRRHLDAKAGS